MANDIPQNVIEETDALAERIFTEWDKWFVGTDEPRKVLLRDLQNELLLLRAKMADETLSHEQKLLIQENITVLTKKIRKNLQDLLSDTQLVVSKESQPEHKKRKRRR